MITDPIAENYSFSLGKLFIRRKSFCFCNARLDVQCYEEIRKLLFPVTKSFIPELFFEVFFCFQFKLGNYPVDRFNLDKQTAMTENLPVSVFGITVY